MVAKDFVALPLISRVNALSGMGAIFFGALSSAFSVRVLVVRPAAAFCFFTGGGSTT